ncbi:unnamed protein product, partial [Meganyctiphanes norvegica]
MASLKSRNYASLKRMINLNSGGGNVGLGAETNFSVLIYDRHGQDVISPLVTVKELREMGITLHLLLHSERGEVPDVPAIYFCQPTEENLVRIGQDFAEGLYSSYYLNFISPISRQKMEDLALAALQAGCQNSIKKVYDQYVNFISLENDMFTLKHQGSEALSYYAINRGDVKDSDIELIMDNIVDSLFSVFVNMGQVPIIRSQRGNAAEMVAERLDKKIRENLRDTRNSFFTGLSADSYTTGQLSFQRPLLVLVDRNVDLATPMHHTWTYQALAHDVLGLSLNRVNVTEVDNSHPNKRTKTKEYDLNDNDLFWSQHKDSPFPSVAAAVETELEEYKAAEAKVKGLKTELQDAEDINLLDDNSAKLVSAITSVPELLKKKANIDKHMNIAMALLNSIKQRKLDVYFEMEEKIMGNAALEKPIIEVIRDNDCGNARDKLRLFMIYYLCSPNVTDAEFSECSEALADIGADPKPLLYMKRLKSYMKIAVIFSQSEYMGKLVRKVRVTKQILDSGKLVTIGPCKNFGLRYDHLGVIRCTTKAVQLDPIDEHRSLYLRFVYPRPKPLPTSDDGGIRSCKTSSLLLDGDDFVGGRGPHMYSCVLSFYYIARIGDGSKRRFVGCSN